MVNPLDLPELRYHLADFLTHETRTLAACAQVCKSWNDSFNPFVWRQLSAAILLPKGHLYRQALEHNGHLIQDLTIGKLDRTRYCLDHITRLKTLQIEDERDYGFSEDPIENFFLNMAHSSLSNPLDELGLDHHHHHPLGYNKRNEWILQLEALLHQNKDLSRLRLKMDRFEPTPHFWGTVAQSCHKLVELECVFTVLTWPQLNPFLTACATTGIRSLVLQHCNFDRFPPEVLAQHCFPAIESLTLATNSCLDLECQLQWMRCCPNLVSLIWTLMGPIQMSVTEFCTVLAEDCPRIESLVMSDRLLEAHHLARILDAVKRLSKFVLRGDSVDSSLLNDPQVMRALERHFGSLRELDFGQERGHVEWESVHQVLTRCARLESLVVHGKVGIRRVVREDGDVQGGSQGTEAQAAAGMHQGHEAQGVVPPPKVISQSESAQPWACLGLRKLQMMLSLPSPTDVMQQPSTTISATAAIPQSSRDMTQQRLMEQIGRMTQLRELLLGPGNLLWMYEQGFSCCRGLDFRLEAGMDQLAGLVRLERLDVEGIQQQRMGVEDVQWMLRHWPSLRLVEGDLNYHKEEREALDKIMKTHGFLVQRGRFLRV
ncbi:hypothetical protein BGZ81_008558 [Podila clonocystis]|nr:hypothetical protein BGZ81_008558 [Podila clonocystis]